MSFIDGNTSAQIVQRNTRTTAKDPCEDVGCNWNKNLYIHSKISIALTAKVKPLPKLSRLRFEIALGDKRICDETPYSLMKM